MTPDQSPQSSSPRRRRIVVRTLQVLLVVLVLIYSAAGWYVSGEIIDALDVTPSDPDHPVEVLAIGDGTITLAVPEGGDYPADRDATLGLRWEGGYLRIGPASGDTGTTETRPFSVMEGSAPAVGQAVAYDGFAFGADPGTIGLAFEEVTYPGPDGDLSAWLVPGDGPLWIVAVHGRGANPREFLRMLDSIRDLRLPALVVRYRNDPGMPRSSGGLVLAGQREWPDVAAAVDFATASGATGVVLAGFSMGGSLVLSYALEQPGAPIRGMILEAPNADLRQVIALRSGEALPVGGPIGDSILAVGRAVTWMRTGIDFDDVDYVARSGGLTAPILLFHGVDDRSVPFEVGESLAEARPDLVEFHAIEDGGHVKAWNEDPEGYRAILTAFLSSLGA